MLLIFSNSGHIIKIYNIDIEYNIDSLDVHVFTCLISLQDSSNPFLSYVTLRQYVIKYK